MKTYIALLRGFNVSGQKIIKMEQLRAVLSELGFENVRTYIQSGNIVFNSNVHDIKDLEHKIQQAIQTHFGFEVPVRITTLDELETIVSLNPFAAKTTIESTQPYVAFLSKTPLEENGKKLQAIDFSQDEFSIRDRIVYLWYAESAGKTKLTNVVLENKLQVVTTSRNWKTIQKLIDLAKN